MFAHLKTLLPVTSADKSMQKLNEKEMAKAKEEEDVCRENSQTHTLLCIHRSEQELLIYGRHFIALSSNI